MSDEQIIPEEPETEQPEPQAEPEVLTVANEASRETSLLNFSIGPGETVRIEEGGYITILSKENFQKVVDWFNESK